MQRLSFLRRGQALFAISALEYLVPFIRIMLLSRFVDLRELGFCSALLASYGLFEQVTDMAFYRFVMSNPREDFGAALASAHALSILRGVVVGGLAIATAPLIAGSLFAQSQLGQLHVSGLHHLCQILREFRAARR